MTDLLATMMCVPPEEAEKFRAGYLADAMRPSSTCPWCGDSFRPPKVVHGKPQKFCSSWCRAGFWKAARRWVANAVACGLLTTDAIKAGGAAVYGSAAPHKAARAVAALQLTRRMITGEQIEHAVVDLAEPDVGLGKYLDRILAGKM